MKTLKELAREADAEADFGVGCLVWSDPHRRVVLLLAWEGALAVVADPETGEVVGRVPRAMLC